VLQTVVIASAGLLLAAAIPHGQYGRAGHLGYRPDLLRAAGTTKIDRLWMILGAALISLTASSIGRRLSLRSQISAAEERPRSWPILRPKNRSMETLPIYQFGGETRLLRRDHNVVTSAASPPPRRSRPRRLPNRPSS
jgi:hypothetical protein